MPIPVDRGTHLCSWAHTFCHLCAQLAFKQFGYFLIRSSIISLLLRKNEFLREYCKFSVLFYWWISFALFVHVRDKPTVHVTKMPGTVSLCLAQGSPRTWDWWARIENLLRTPLVMLYFVFNVMWYICNYPCKWYFVEPQAENLAPRSHDNIFQTQIWLIYLTQKYKKLVCHDNMFQIYLTQNCRNTTYENCSTQFL